MSDQDTDIAALTAQAMGAIHLGADPDAVNQELYKQAAALGYDPSKLSFNLQPDNPPAPKPARVRADTKEAYKNVVVPEVVQDARQLNRFDFSPNATRGAAAAEPLPREVGFGESFERAANKAQAATAGLLAPISYLGAQGANIATGESPQSYGDYLKTIQNVKQASAPQQGEDFSGVSAGVGQALGQLSVDVPQALLTTPVKGAQALVEAPEAITAARGIYDAAKVGLVGGIIPSASEASSVYTDAKAEGNSETEALAKAGKAGLMKEAQFALPGSVSGNIARRAAVGAGIGVATSVPQEYADTGKISLANTLTSAGLGAVMGSVGGHEPEARVNIPDTPRMEEPVIKTGDAAVDSGIDFANKLASTEYGTIDLAKQFQEHFDPGYTYKAPEEVPTSVNIEQSPADAVRKLNETEAAYQQRARENTDTAFAQSDREQNAQDISRAAVDDDTSVPATSEPVSNNPLATPEMQQLRSQLQVEQAPETAQLPAQPAGVNVNVVPADEAFMRPSKRTLGKQTLNVDEAGNTLASEPARSPSRARQPAPPVDDLNASIAAAEGRRDVFGQSTPRLSPAREFIGTNGNPLFHKPEQIPTSVLSALDRNTLTGRQVLQSVIQDHGSLFTNAHEARGFAQVLHDAGEHLGGLDTKIEVFDKNNPNHAAVANAFPETFSKGAALFDPTSNTVILSKNVGMGAIVHEVGHAVTEKAISLGEQGKLRGPSAQSFATLQNLFESLKPVLQEKAEANVRAAATKGDAAVSVVKRNQTYGLQDLHEFMAEMHGNGAFRNHLKSIKLDSAEVTKLGGMSRLVIGKVKNAYDATVKLVRGMLGLSPKADNALDAMFSSSHDFLKSFDSTELGAIRKSNARNTAGTEPDMSFLGERAQSRYAPSEEDNLQKPRGRVTTTARSLLSSKGIEPVVTNARNTRSGIMAEGSAEAVQSANRLAAVRTKENSSDLAAALQGSREAYDKLAPAAKEVVKAEYTNNFDRSMTIAKSIAADPNATGQQKAIAKKIVENAGKYQTRVYEQRIIKKYSANKLAAYEQVKNALAKNPDAVIDGKDLAAYQSVDVARKYLENTWLPDTDKLGSRHTDQLEDLYKMHTGLDPDKQFKGMETKERRQALIGATAAAMRKIVSKDDFLDNIVKASAGLGEKKSTTRQYYANLRRDGAVFSELKDVPEELRQFWGEIADPVARNMATVRQQYNYLANLKAQNQLRTEGLGKIFTDKGGVKGYTETITGEKMGPLQGLHVTPDVKKALDSVFMMDSTLGDLLDSSVSDHSGMGLMLNLGKQGIQGVGKAAGLAKMWTVLGNVGNFANNFVGSHLQLLSNGNINPVAMAKGVRTMLDTMGTSVRSKMSEDARDALRHGLVEFSHIQELQGSRNSEKIKEILTKAAGTQNPATSVAKQVLAMGKEGTALYKELYGAMDLWTKMANWHNELGFWNAHNEKYNTGLTPEQIKTNVGRRINDTNITPSMAPQLLRAVEKVGITRFGTYYAEVARTLKNNIAVGSQDMLDGVRNAQPDLALHGFQRMLGSATSIIAQNKQFAALAKITAGAMGLAATQMDKDDPRKKYMDKDDFMSSMDPMLINDPAHPEAGTYVYDLSRADPYAPIMTPIKQFLDSAHALANGDKKEAEDKAKLAAGNMYDLWSKNTIWNALTKATTGATPSLAKIAPTTYDMMAKKLTDAGMSVKGANSFLDAMQPFEPASVRNYLQSKEVKSPSLSKAVAAGQGLIEFNPAKDLSGYMGAAAKADITKAKGNYLDLMKQNYESDPSRLDKAFVSTLKDAAKPYEQMRLAVEAAKKQGTPRMEIIRRMTDSGVPEDLIGTLLYNRPIQVYSLMGNLESDYKKDVLDNLGDKPKEKESLDRLVYNTKQMMRLMKQYKNTNVEEL